LKAESFSPRVSPLKYILLVPLEYSRFQ